MTDYFEVQLNKVEKAVNDRNITKPIYVGNLINEKPTFLNADGRTISVEGVNIDLSVISIDKVNSIKDCLDNMGSEAQFVSQEMEASLEA